MKYSVLVIFFISLLTFNPGLIMCRDTIMPPGTGSKFTSSLKNHENLQKIRMYGNNLVKPPDWKISKEQVFDYDENDNIIGQLWVEVSGSNYINQRKETSTYLHDSLVGSVLVQTWINGAWVNKSLAILGYDSMDRKTSELFTVWNDTLNKWDNLSLSLSEYDQYSRISSSVQQKWEAVDSVYSWHDKNKCDYTYNDRDQLIESYWYSWDGSWFCSEHRLYKYNDHGIDTMEAYIMVSDSWKKVFSYEYSYLKNEDTLTVEAVEKNGLNQPLDKFKSVYLDNTYLIMSARSNWKDSLWIDDSRTFYVYNDNGDLSIDSTQEMIYGDWIDIDKSVYIYPSTDVIEYNNRLNTDISILPVPAGETANIYLPENIDAGIIKISDMTGRTVFESKASSRVTSIDTGGLPAGVYFVQVFVNNILIIKPMIVTH